MRTLIIGMALVSAIGCGKKGNTTPDDGEEHTDPVGPGSGEQYSNDPDQVPPEKIDESMRLLSRKQNVVARCLSIAVDNKELPKSTKGKITLAVIIGRDGSPKSVKVAASTIESASLGACVVEQIKKIQFPTMPKDFETSYTYGLEAM